MGRTVRRKYTSERLIRKKLESYCKFRQITELEGWGWI